MAATFDRDVNTVEVAEPIDDKGLQAIRVLVMRGVPIGPLLMAQVLARLDAAEDRPLVADPVVDALQEAQDWLASRHAIPCEDCDAGVPRFILAGIILHVGSDLSPAQPCPRWA